MGAGKTTAAEWLVANHGYHRMSLAEPLRQLVARLVGRPIDKKLDRELLQRTAGAARAEAWRGVGAAAKTGYRGIADDLAHHLFTAPTREQVETLASALIDDGYAKGWGQELYWLQRWQLALEAAPRPVVVDDARFALEARFMQPLGFHVVRLDVPLEERQRRILARDGRWDPAWEQDATEREAATIPADDVLDGVGRPDEVAARVLAAASVPEPA